MAITYIKKAEKTAFTGEDETRTKVSSILKDLEKTKDQGVKDILKKFDNYEGDIIVSKEKIEEINKTLDQKIKDDIQFSHERVRKFAEHQLENLGKDSEVELSPGLIAGQKLIPVNTVGCYVESFYLYWLMVMKEMLKHK